jgi:hypothetical protein
MNKDELFNIIITSVQQYTGDDIIINRDDRRLKYIAFFYLSKSKYAIYKDIDNNDYCVHIADYWNEYDEPLFGYYHSSLDWNKFIEKLSLKIINVRDSIHKFNINNIIDT